jgi:cysteinyl-tRNA synthetase
MKSENKTLKEITNKYADAFFEDLAVLNIIPANRYPRATEHIHDIEEMISTLVEKGFAYIEAGSVYFRVSAFSSYGQMVNLDASDIKEGAGGSGPNERRGRQDKENERDFVLWKAFAEGDGEVVWDSKFGRGRPGWHIECSAMINSILGKTIDIHAGGVDLMFPHHTNEIAQSEAYSGQKMCNCWIHNGFVNINNEKMSKSLKNFKTLRDIASTAFDARAFRFMIVSAQYRAALNYAPDTFSSAVSSLKRIDKMVAALKVSASVTGGNGAVESIYTETSLQEYLDAFELAMCDDLNTARAMAAVFGLVNAAEKGINVGKGLAPDEAKNILSVFLKMDSVLGLIYDVPKAYFTTADVAVEAIPEEMYNLARKRSSFKASKMYAEADAVRQELANAGYVVKDLKGGEFELLRI